MGLHDQNRMAFQNMYFTIAPHGKKTDCFRYYIEPFKFVYKQKRVRPLLFLGLDL